MNSESMGGILIREFLHAEEQCSVENSTLIIHFSLLKQGWFNAEQLNLNQQ
jgi:hypothetical protein